MGSFVEINDTLQISNEQGFPSEFLDINKHIKTPYKLDDLKDVIFEFKNKPDIRMYQQFPVRNFLVQNVDNKWIYWGLVHIIEVTHDYVNKMTSGKYKILHINSVEEMKFAYDIVDRRENFNWFNK